MPDDETRRGLDQKSVDFLWLNRLIPERRSDWFIKVLGNKEFEHTDNIMAGFLTKTSYTKEQDYVLNNKPNNLKTLDYVSHPSTLYINAKFFVLPAKIIFANNALLEAMSYGVVPIVTNAPGANLIIEHERNGFIADFNENSLAISMKKALDLSQEEYMRMSTAAKNHVFKNFSPELYKQKLTELYQLIQN
jgi:glycosyltransferase involved in cell wall biosynthesis